jgi:hypothetical protein
MRACVCVGGRWDRLWVSKPRPLLLFASARRSPPQISNLLYWANIIADLVEKQHANVVVALESGQDLTALVRRA